MKLSVESGELCAKVGYDEGLRLIKEAGFDAVDFSYYGLPADSPILGDNYREYAIKTREFLDEINLECNQAHAPFNLSKTEKFDMSEPHYREIVRSIESAAILGAKSIVVHHVYVPQGETVNGITYEEYNYIFYKSLEPYCKEYGINIAIENMFYYDAKKRRHKGMLHTPQALKSIIEKLDSPYFIACIDIGHLAIIGEEPEDVLREMQPSILKALHVHDNDFLSDRHSLPFTGGINWQNVMDALKNIGYTGDLTFEICSFVNKMPDVLISDALKFAQKVGRYLISTFE